MGSRIIPNKTWFIDIDGTIFNHKSNFDFDESDKIYDQILEGVEEFWEKIPADDYIILTTARPGWWKEMTIYSLEKYGLRYNQLIFDIPSGTRVLVNDNKPPLDPDGLNPGRTEIQSAHAICVHRNEGLNWDRMASHII